MDASCAADESATLRTAKSCGPDAPTLASSFVEATPGGDGGKKARSPGRARNKLLTPSRAGMPGDPGATVVTNACVLLLYTRGCGCNGHPAFPTPSLGGSIMHQLGRYPRPGSAKSYLSYPRHCERSEAIHHAENLEWIASSRRSFLPSPRGGGSPRSGGVG
jgi:hypothetical protein